MEQLNIFYIRDTHWLCGHSGWVAVPEKLSACPPAIQIQILEGWLRDLEADTARRLARYTKRFSAASEIDAGEDRQLRRHQRVLATHDIIAASLARPMDLLLPEAFSPEIVLGAARVDWGSGDGEVRLDPIFSTLPQPLHVQAMLDWMALLDQAYQVLTGRSYFPEDDGTYKEPPNWRAFTERRSRPTHPGSARFFKQCKLLRKEQGLRNHASHSAIQAEMAKARRELKALYQGVEA